MEHDVQNAEWHVNISARMKPHLNSGLMYITYGHAVPTVKG